jgi:hypothetical protein
MKSRERAMREQDDPRIFPFPRAVLRKRHVTRIVQRITPGKYERAGIVECTEVIKGRQTLVRVVMPSIVQWRRWAKDAEVEG